VVENRREKNASEPTCRRTAEGQGGADSDEATARPSEGEKNQEADAVTWDSKESSRKEGRPGEGGQM